VSYRLIGRADDRIKRVLAESARAFGIAASERYYRLMLATFAVLGDDPRRPGSIDLPTVPGVRIYPLRAARDFVAPAYRVKNPRHLVIYRVAPDGVVEIVGVAHDRMELARAARRMQGDAEH
jgi:toxin ParE1/3/4